MIAAVDRLLFRRLAEAAARVSQGFHGVAPGKKIGSENSGTKRHRIEIRSNDAIGLAKRLCGGERSAGLR